MHDTSFYANTLHASFVADDAQTYTATPTGNGLFKGLGAINFDDGSHGMYDVDYADVFAPATAQSSALVYNTASAAVQYASGCTRLVYSGVPFETIYPRATRQAMMTRLIEFSGRVSAARSGGKHDLSAGDLEEHRSAENRRPRPYARHPRQWRI